MVEQEGQKGQLQNEADAELLEAQKLDEWVKKMNEIKKDLEKIAQGIDPLHPSEVSILESTLLMQTRLTIHWMARAQKAERQLRSLLLVKRN